MNSQEREGRIEPQNRSMRARVLRLIGAALLLVFASAQADYVKALDKLGQELAPKLPKGCTVVVFNMLRDGTEETHLAIDLAIKLAGSIAAAGPKRYIVLRRTQGESLAVEERKYTAKSLTSDEMGRLLRQFRASVGVTGNYSIVGRSLVLENLCAQGIPTLDRPPAIVCSRNKVEIPLDSSELALLRQRDRPVLADSAASFLISATTDSSFISSVLIVNTSGEPLANNTAKIGEFYRMELRLKRDVFLYVFSYDEDHGNAYLMYPLARVTQPQAAGKLSIPDPQQFQGYQAIAPAGSNFVKVFASIKPIPLKVANSDEYVLTSTELDGFVRELRNLSQDEWSSWRIFVTVRQ